MAIDHLDVLRRECRRVSELARSVDHTAAVPHLAGWTAHDVVAHLAGDFLWVLGTLATRERPRTGLVAVETRGSALCDEWDAVAERLIARLDGIDPDEPCPNFAQGERGRLGFHPRHQAFETTVHRWDLEAAAGTDHAAIDVAVAVDAIDELFETYTVRYSPHDVTAPITLGCTDAGTAWRVAPAERDGFVTVERTDGEAADLRTTAAALLLVLWRRIDPATEHPGVRAFLTGPVTV